MLSAEATPAHETSAQHSPPKSALDALNFFLADVRDGLGPYIAIYLLVVSGPSHGWNEATVGMVLTIAGIIGLLSQTPAGGLIDRTRNKPRVVIVAALPSRKLVQRKLIDIDSDMLGTLRNFGLKVGVVSAVGYEARIRHLVEEFPRLAAIVEPLLTVRQVMRQQSPCSTRCCATRFGMIRSASG
jgi:hypothetical protein